MEGIKWDKRIRNVEVLRRVGEERKILTTIRKRKKIWKEHCLRKKKNITRDYLEGMVNDKRSRGKRRMQLVHNIKVSNKYETTNRITDDTESWRSSYENLLYSTHTLNDDDELELSK